MADDNTPDPKAKIREKNAKRPSRAKEPTGPVNPREMTKLRDRVGDIRDKLELELRETEVDRHAIEKIRDEAATLWTDMDRLDLRFKIHNDPKVLAEKAALARGPG